MAFPATGLNPDKIKHIFYSSLRILEEVGIGCSHMKTVDALTQKGRIQYKNGRIHFNKDAVEECFQQTVKPFSTSDNADVETEFQLGGQWQALELCDPLTNGPRLATYDEAVQMSKLAEALGEVVSPIPVAPSGFNPRMNTLVSEKIALIHTRKRGGSLTATDREEINIISQMYQAAGRKYRLSLNGLISPLKLSSEIMETYFNHCDDENINTVLSGPMALAGATAPLVFPANISFTLAETLGLNYVAYTLSDGKRSSPFYRFEPFDFKSGNVMVGAPAWCLFRLAIKEFWEGLTGQKILGGAFRTNSRIADAQAIMECTASVVWQALLGARIFGGVGIMAIDEVFSPVLAILDREILNYARDLCKGYAKTGWDEETDILTLAKEGVEAGGFLGHETTVSHFRDMFDFDVLSSYAKLNTWRNAGSVTMEALAWQKAQSVIESHDFTLDVEKRRDVEKLYDFGVKYLENL